MFYGHCGEPSKNNFRVLDAPHGYGRTDTYCSGLGFNSFPRRAVSACPRSVWGTFPELHHTSAYDNLGFSSKTGLPLGLLFIKFALGDVVMVLRKTNRVSFESETPFAKTQN